MKAFYFFITTILFLVQTRTVKADGLKINLADDDFTSSTELMFTPTSTLGFEKGLDREYRKLPGNHVNYIYTIAEAKHKLYVNYLQRPSTYIAIDLQIVVQKAGTFSFSIEDRANNLTDFDFSLTDVATGETTTIIPDNMKEMTFTAADVRKKKNFILHMFPSIKFSASQVSCSGSKNGTISVMFNPGGEWAAILKDGSSNILETKKNATDKIAFENLGAGVYYVEIWMNHIKIKEEITAVSKPAGLQSKFTLSDDTINAGKKISTNNLSFGGDRWHWEFGDGNSSNGYDVTHTYSAPGNYTVTLTTSNTTGCTSTTSKKVLVESSQGKPLTLTIH